MYFSPKKIIILGVCAVLLFGALGVLSFKKSEAVRAFVRPSIADNIILIQNIRKLSDVIFLPQIILGEDSLPHLKLTLSGRDFEKLNEALPKGDYTEIEAAGLVFNALEGSAKKRVNAKLIFDGKEYDARAGFRGTTYDHWYYPKKSWHLTFLDESPFGFTEADLIIPRDRDYLGEELNHFRSRKFRLFVPESEFVTLSINGGGKMIYWLVEDWSATMPAAHGRTGCLFGATLLQGDAHNAPFSNISLWQEYTTSCGADGIQKVAALLALLELPDAEFPRAAAGLLDIEKVLRWEAAARLAGSGHAYGYNMRVFWDAATRKFEFIPWDFGLEALGDGPLDSYYNDFVTRLFEHEKYVARRNAILAEYVNAPENLQGDLAYYDDLASKTEAAFYKDRMKTASILAVNEEIAKGREAVVGNVEKIKTTLGIGAGGLAATGASAAPRIEYEEILAIPYEKREEVWAYLKERFSEGEGKLSAMPSGRQARLDTEEFTDVYFDTRELALLDQEAIVRYRTRSRDDKEPLVQIKTGGDAISRGEWKFAVKTDAGRAPLVGRIVKKEQKEFTDKIASLLPAQAGGAMPDGRQASASSLQPILELAQERRRIYFSENGEDVLAISLDLASTKRWWAEAEFASVDIEINEIAYTEASEARRAELRAAQAALVADIIAQFPDITPDRTPKYVKAFSALAEKIPMYRFLIKTGIL